MFNRISTVVKRRCSSMINSYTQRTHTCGELSITDQGKEVTVMGWLVKTRMDRFLVLRDSYGTVQATVSDQGLSQMVKGLTLESVVQIKGLVKDREKDRNPKMSTGDIEIEVSELSVLNRAPSAMPLIPDAEASERTRLRYRYIDLRSSQLQRALRMRSEIVHNIRRFLVEDRGFVDVETPTLFRRTPGGANEFVVPAAPPNQGLCYSLPQSPQQFKQLLMVGGIDRYFQIARCYRDEGAKGDRQPEFTQVDVELSFTTENGVMALIEDMILASWPKELNDLKPSRGFPRLQFSEAMRLYGSDKPDMRIPWTIQDCTQKLEFMRPSGASGSWNAGALVCKGAAAAATNRLKTEWAKTLNIDPLSLSFRMQKIGSKQWFADIENEDFAAELGAEKDDVIVFCVGDLECVQWTLGRLRNLVAEAMGLRKQRKMTAHWVVGFPLFSVEKGKLVSTHHPFTASKEDQRQMLRDRENLRDIQGMHFDLVINGVEVGGGSIRIHSAEEQKIVFDVLKEDSNELNHLVEALSHGAPPHGGFAIGLDRYIALLASSGDPALPVREVMAFPKTKEGRDVLSDSPTMPTTDQLRRYGFSFNADVPIKFKENE